MVLTQQEIYELTHRINPTAQLRYLAQLGIEARRRPDNTVLVLRSAVEAALGGVAQNREDKVTEPDWSAI
jgi:hypothetical protein